MERKLESLKIQIEALSKLAGYYKDDPVAAAEAESKKRGLEQEIIDLSSKISELKEANKEIPNNINLNESNNIILEDLIPTMDDTPLDIITTKDFDPQDPLEIPDTDVPVIVADTIKALLPEINFQGLFRESANANVLKQLKEHYKKKPG